MYKIECRFIYGWDDAGWEWEDDSGKMIPMRFYTTDDAQLAIDDFIFESKKAFMRGDIAAVDNADDYRIVIVGDEPVRALQAQ